MRLILILIVTHLISAQDYNGVIIKYDGFENVTTEPNWKVCYLKFVLENNSGQEIEYSGWDDQDLLQIFVPNNNGFTKVKFGVCGNGLKRIKVAGGKKATLKLPVMWYNINTGWGDLKYPNGFMVAIEYTAEYNREYMVMTKGLELNRKEMICGN